MYTGVHKNVLKCTQKYTEAYTKNVQRRTQKGVKHYNKTTPYRQFIQCGVV